MCATTVQTSASFKNKILFVCLFALQWEFNSIAFVKYVITWVIGWYQTAYAMTCCSLANTVCIQVNFELLTVNGLLFGPKLFSQHA